LQADSATTPLYTGGRFVLVENRSVQSMALAIAKRPAGPPARRTLCQRDSCLAMAYCSQAVERR
jgi:hypothetical protein